MTTQPKNEFLPLEYQAVQERMKFLREDLIRTETLAPLAVSAIYSWIFTNGTLVGTGRIAILWIPVLLSTIAYMRQKSRYRSVLKLEEYTRNIEAELAVGTNLPGYETWLLSSHGPRKPLPWLRMSRNILWASMLLGSLWLALLNSIGSTSLTESTVTVTVPHTASPPAR